MAYSLEARQKARDLFVESGLSYKDLARETGISKNNLKKWGSEEGWTKQRDEYQKEFASFHAKIGKLKLQLVTQAIETSDPQKIYALSNLMRAGNLSNGPGAVDRPALFIEWMGQLMEHIKAKDPDALRHLEPHIRSFAEEIKTGERREA